jgi:UDP-N-acetyl-2-amino-2-deoxyglucuronate dehydrogenase
MSELRAGVIGYGYTGRLHLRAYERSGILVTAVAETRPDALATAPPKVEGFQNYLDLLQSDIDLVSVCAPTALHHRITLDALAAGKHVLLEKPIATTVSDAEAMIESARQFGKILFVGMTHRFYPEIREAKRIVDDGGIGEIVMVRDSILEHFGFLNSPGWYLQPELAGGGTVLSSGIHLIDRVMWFLKELPNSVSGYARNRFLGRGVEDAAQMSLGFPSGRCAQILFGLLPEPHPLICDLELIGTRGSIVVHTWNGYEHRSGARSDYHATYGSESHPEKVLNGICNEVEEFCTAIHEGRNPRPSVEESTQALRVIMAFYRAFESGTIQQPEYRDA